MEQTRELGGSTSQNSGAVVDDHDLTIARVVQHLDGRTNSMRYTVPLPVAETYQYTSIQTE